MADSQPTPPPDVPNEAGSPPTDDPGNELTVSEDDDQTTIDKKIRHFWSVKCRQEGKSLGQLWEERRPIAEESSELVAVLGRMAAAQERALSRHWSYLVIAIAAFIALLPWAVLLPLTMTGTPSLCHHSQHEALTSQYWHRFAAPAYSRDPNLHVLNPSTPALDQWSMLASFVRRDPRWEEEALRARLPERYMLLQQAIGHAGSIMTNLTEAGGHHQQEEYDEALSSHQTRHASRVSGTVLERARMRLYIQPPAVRPRRNGSEEDVRVMTDFRDVAEELDSLLDIAGLELRGMVPLAER
ncbi:hypothetical protein Tdes44962_MAKER03141 [Teratosphaeria destructans]|uniref:Uncharacterized protein n=1 Tax=Teratosphaeria destructans TaxID=418781 RepID=A0A9W7W261_9PEZI|nr:hypothetical protein Tdes44962_MAKER03141 [Teratosphaeria destructans]